MLAVTIDQQPILAHLIPELGVHAVDAILHRRVHAGHAEGDIESISMAPKELLHDLPIGTGGRGSALIGGSVAIDGDREPATRAPLFGAAQELFAGGQGIRVG
jgi:hypothetical protein